MRNRWQMVLALALVVVAGLGLGRIRFETDPLAVLPRDLPEVEGLRAFQEGFSRDEELVVVLQGEEELERKAEELAGLLEQAKLGKSVRWRPHWRDDPAGLAELFAWLWLNAEPETVAARIDGLSQGRLDETLHGALERVATSMEGGEMMISAHDPLGLLDLPALNELFSAAEEGGGFVSADGRTHLLLVDAPRSLPGYEEAQAWIDEVRRVAEPWAVKRGVAIGFTGDPAFEAEIGGAMQRDMSSTIGVTSALIGILFLLMQRRVLLLVGLTVVLGMVFLVAMGSAGWIYEELSIMAAGFAAILIGLAVDYGVLICQEAKVAGHSTGALKQATTRSILGAAVTTAAVFLALNFSGLPGISQLGTVVAIGVLVGAILMLILYLPWVAKQGSGRSRIGHQGGRLPRRRVAVGFTAGLSVAALGVLLSIGPPGVAFDPALLRPRNSSAMEEFEKIQEAFPSWGDRGLKLLVRGDAQTEERLGHLEGRLNQLQMDHPDLVSGYHIPRGWWPSPARIEANRAAIQGLADDRERLITAASDFGFSDEGVALDRQILEALPAVLSMPSGSLPSNAAARELLRGVMSLSPERPDLLGYVEIHQLEDLDPARLALLESLRSDGVELAGWALLKPAVLPLVKQDLTHVFLPMVGLMVVMLAVVFRNAKDVLTALLGMGLSGVLLLAVMRLTGLYWNFLNIAATPLLLGTGLDYMIHIVLAIRRTGGDWRAVWNGTGKAVLFCGGSTAIGFGSLAFASIEALASLGKVAVVGILISMVVSVILVPALRAGGAGAKQRQP
ncbi:MAG: MMPL family transporter [Verrucomicrobiales bacterium]